MLGRRARAEASANPSVVQRDQESRCSLLTWTRTRTPSSRVLRVPWRVWVASHLPRRSRRRPLRRSPARHSRPTARAGARQAVPRCGIEPSLSSCRCDTARQRARQRVRSKPQRGTWLVLGECFSCSSAQRFDRPSPANRKPGSTALRTVLTMPAAASCEGRTSSSELVTCPRCTIL